MSIITPCPVGPVALISPPVMRGAEVEGLWAGVAQVFYRGAHIDSPVCWRVKWAQVEHTEQWLEERDQIEGSSTFSPPACFPADKLHIWSGSVERGRSVSFLSWEALSLGVCRMLVMLLVAVGVWAQNSDSHAADVCLAGHEGLKINQSIKLRIKHTLTTMISFFMTGYQLQILNMCCICNTAWACNELWICAYKCNRKVNIALLEIWSLHSEVTLYCTTNCKTQHCLTTRCITSPQERKTNNFHQIDLDANGVLTHGGKWHLFPIFLFFPPLCAALQIKWSVCDSLMLAEATASRALDCKCSLRGPALVWYT